MLELLTTTAIAALVAGSVHDHDDLAAPVLSAAQTCQVEAFASALSNLEAEAFEAMRSAHQVMRTSPNDEAAIDAEWDRYQALSMAVETARYNGRAVLDQCQASAQPAPGAYARSAPAPDAPATISRTEPYGSARSTRSEMERSEDHTGFTFYAEIADGRAEYEGEIKQYIAAGDYLGAQSVFSRQWWNGVVREDFRAQMIRVDQQVAVEDDIELEYSTDSTLARFGVRRDFSRSRWVEGEFEISQAFNATGTGPIALPEDGLAILPRPLGSTEIYYGGAAAIGGFPIIPPSQLSASQFRTHDFIFLWTGLIHNGIETHSHSYNRDDFTARLRIGQSFDSWFDFTISPYVLLTSTRTDLDVGEATIYRVLNPRRNPRTVDTLFTVTSGDEIKGNTFGAGGGIRLDTPRFAIGPGEVFVTLDGNLAAEYGVWDIDVFEKQRSTTVEFNLRGDLSYQFPTGTTASLFIMHSDDGYTPFEVTYAEPVFVAGSVSVSRPFTSAVRGIESYRTQLFQYGLRLSHPF